MVPEDQKNMTNMKRKMKNMTPSTQNYVFSHCGHDHNLIVFGIVRQLKKL